MEEEILQWHHEVARTEHVEGRSPIDTRDQSPFAMRDVNIRLIRMMFEQIDQEHVFLYGPLQALSPTFQQSHNLLQNCCYILLGPNEPFIKYAGALMEGTEHKCYINVKAQIMVTANVLTCQCRFQLVSFPITSFIRDVLPDNARHSTRGQFFFSDLEQMAPQDVAQLYKVGVASLSGRASLLTRCI